MYTLIAREAWSELLELNENHSNQHILQKEISLKHAAQIHFYQRLKIHAFQIAKSMLEIGLTACCWYDEVKISFYERILFILSSPPYSLHLIYHTRRHSEQIRLRDLICNGVLCD